MVTKVLVVWTPLILFLLIAKFTTSAVADEKKIGIGANYSESSDYSLGGGPIFRVGKVRLNASYNSVIYNTQHAESAVSAQIKWLPLELKWEGAASSISPSLGIGLSYIFVKRIYSSDDHVRASLNGTGGPAVNAYVGAQWEFFSNYFIGAGASYQILFTQAAYCTSNCERTLTRFFPFVNLGLFLF